MARKTVSIFIVLLVLMAGSVVSAEQVSVESLPPSVVKTVPVCGDTTVDPALTEIRVTFSKNDAFRDTQGHPAVPYMLVFTTK